MIKVVVKAGKLEISPVPNEAECFRESVPSAGGHKEAQGYDQRPPFDHQRAAFGIENVFEIGIVASRNQSVVTDHSSKTFTGSKADDENAWSDGWHAFKGDIRGVGL